MPTFVLNDETKVNSYGFRIPNKGINLERFKANPVMLDQHLNDTRSVLGRWNDVQVTGSQLLADSEFDTEDADAKKIEGKVSRGYIKGASMGVTFNRDYFILAEDGVYELTQCELFEASIVAIPSNANAITLFTESGEPMSQDEIKLNLSALTAKSNNENLDTQKMEKIALSAAALVALGLTVAPENSNELNTAIERLQAKLTAEKSDKEALQNKLNAQKESQAKAMLSEAKLAGKITAEEETEMLSDAIANPEGTAKLLAKIPAKVSLSKQVDNKPAGDAQVKTIDDFEKLSDEAKLAFKTENPDAYKALFK